MVLEADLFEKVCISEVMFYHGPAIFHLEDLILRQFIHGMFVEHGLLVLSKGVFWNVTCHLCCCLAFPRSIDDLSVFVKIWRILAWIG